MGLAFWWEGVCWGWNGGEAVPARTCFPEPRGSQTIPLGPESMTGTRVIVALSSGGASLDRLRRDRPELRRPGATLSGPAGNLAGMVTVAISGLFSTMR